jgi:hypothetical protein
MLSRTTLTGRWQVVESWTEPSVTAILKGVA